jgi:hypothetical protein
MQNNIETRKIPKQNLIIILIVIVLGIFSYFIAKNGKTSKVTKILYSLNYKNINNIKVYGVTKVEDENTRIQGYKYFVIFTDKTTKKECRGFVMKDFKQNVKKDISCKDKK